MKFEYESKLYNIPDKTISSYMKSLGLSKNEACMLYLEDEEILDNAEQSALDEKAKSSKITATIHGAGTVKPRKPREVTRKEDLVKNKIFVTVLQMLEAMEETSDIEIIKQNKLIRFKLGKDLFDIDIIRKNPNKLKGEKK